MYYIKILLELYLTKHRYCSPLLFWLSYGVVAIVSPTSIYKVTVSMSGTSLGLHDLNKLGIQICIKKIRTTSS